MGLGGVLIVVGLVGIWEGSGAYSFGKPSPGKRWWQNPAGGERAGGFLMVVTGAIFVVVGIILVLVDLLS